VKRTKLFLNLLLVMAASAVAAAQTASQALPRTPDGKPDFSGVWQVLNSAAYDIEDHNAEPGVPAGTGVVVGGEIPYQASALEQRKQNYANRATDDTDAKCYLPGVPRITYMPYPFRIIQTPERIDISYEYVGALRHVFMNTPHPRGPIEWWMGDSRGHWEGDALVVDVVHFNDQTRFDKAGNFHSELLHVVERYSFIDATHVNYEVTIEDPKVFTRPWKMQMPLYKRIDAAPRVLSSTTATDSATSSRCQRGAKASSRPFPARFPAGAPGPGCSRRDARAARCPAGD
jgi:hypothetical protein